MKFEQSLNEKESRLSTNQNKDVFRGRGCDPASCIKLFDLRELHSLALILQSAVACMET